MKEYLKKNGIRLGVVIAAVLVALLAGRVLGGRADFLTNAIVTVREPIRQAASSVADWLDGIYGYLFEYEQLKAENESLKIQLAEGQGGGGPRGAGRPGRERTLPGTSWALPKHSDFVFESARIVSWSASRQLELHDKQRARKTASRSATAWSTNTARWSGRSRSWASSATVRTLIDVDTSIGALVGADGSAAMLMGDYTLMRQGQVKVTWLTGARSSSSRTTC